MAAEDEAVGDGGAPEGEAEALARQADALAQEGRFAEAEPLYRALVRGAKARFGKGDPGHGAALYTLARVLATQGKHDEAEGLLRRALVIFTRAPGPAHPAYEQVLQALAGVLGAADKFTEAEAVLREALATQEKALGPDHPSLGPTLTNLAIALVQEQRLAEAEPLVQRSLRLCDHDGGAEAPPRLAERARILTVLAQIQDALGADGAPATARRALAALAGLSEADRARVGDAEPILREIAEPGADLDAQLDEGADALEAHDVPRALSILEPLAARARREGLLPLEASACGMLAQALFVSGRRGEAREHAARALAIAEAANEAEAIAHFRALVEAMDAAPPPDAFDTRIEEAVTTARSGDVAGAIRALEALAAEAEEEGEGAREASVRVVLGQILATAGDPGGAVQLRRALALAEALGDTAAAAHVRRMLDT